MPTCKAFVSEGDYVSNGDTTLELVDARSWGAKHRETRHSSSMAGGGLDFGQLVGQKGIRRSNPDLYQELIHLVSMWRKIVERMVGERKKRKRGENLNKARDA